jgi:prepilin-type N-terminal cleavage/methylation domain-containing protein
MRQRFGAARRAVGRRLSREGGFTFPELTVAILVTGIIAAAGVTFVVVSTHQWGDQQGRVSATDKARNALIQMTSELRDATSVKLVNARTVDASVWNADGTVTNVRFACATTTCTRTIVSTGSQETLVTDVSNADNFAKVFGSDVTGTTSRNGALQIKLELEIDNETSTSGPENPMSLVATVKPRNCVASPATGVLNPTC